MAPSNRSTLIGKLFKVVKKHYKPVSPTAEKPLLENLLYACCLENTHYEKADLAFQRINEVSFDWNEVRVTSLSELSELMSQLPDPRAAATNLKRLLQSVFESQYSFDLEHLKKQNLGKTIKQLEKYDGTTAFAIAHATQHSLGGHAVPLDRGALDVMFITGIIDEKERARHVAPGLERAIPKKQGIEFGSLLHQLGADLVASPFSPQVRATLLEINPQAKERLPKRPSRKKTKAGGAETGKAPQKSPPVKKDGKKPTKAVKKKQPPPAAAKAAKKKTSKRKSATKQLVKRKPR